MTHLNTIIEEEKAKNKAIAITVRLENEVFHGRFSSSTLECIEKIIAEEITSAMQRAYEAGRADWLRSEIEKLEGMKGGIDDIEIPPPYKTLAGKVTFKNGHNEALTSIITRYTEELKVLESK